MGQMIGMGMVLLSVLFMQNVRVYLRNNVLNNGLICQFLHQIGSDASGKDLVAGNTIKEPISEYSSFGTTAVVAVVASAAAYGATRTGNYRVAWLYAKGGGG